MSIVAEKHELTKKDARAVVDTLLAEIATAIKADREVTLPGFGRFKARRRAATTARNIRTGAAIKVPAKRVPAFVPSKALKDAVAG